MAARPAGAGRAAGRPRRVSGAKEMAEKPAPRLARASRPRLAPYGLAEPDGAGEPVTDTGTTGAEGAAVGAADGIGPLPGG